MKRKTIRYLLQAWLAKGFIGLFRCMSFERASAVGGWLGRIIGRRLKAHRIAKTNLSKMMPQLSSTEQQSLLTSMWDNLGRTAGEFPHLSQLSKSEFERITKVHNQAVLDQVKAAHAHKRPVIFFSGHFANWEILPRAAKEWGVPLALVYRKANNSLVDDMILSIRKNYQTEGISKTEGGMRRIVEVLKEGRALGMLVDQRASEGISIPLLGKDAKTASAIANFALKYHALLVPVQIERLDGKAKFNITLHKPLDIVPTKNAKQDAIRIMIQINELLGAFIQAAPSQWFWVHRRWH